MKELSPATKFDGTPYHFILLGGLIAVTKSQRSESLKDLNMRYKKNVLLNEPYGFYNSITWISRDFFTLAANREPRLDHLL